jgi:hypothetical protein
LQGGGSCAASGQAKQLKKRFLRPIIEIALSVEKENKNMPIILLALIPPLLLFAAALLLLWLPLPPPFPPAASSARNLMAAATTGLLGLAYVAGLAVYLVGSVRQAGRALDEALASHALQAGNYHLVGRQYHGQINGRPVTIIYTPPYALQPALLNVYVAAELAGRAAIAVNPARPLLDCRDCPPVELPGAGYHIYSAPEEWVRRLLAEPAAAAPVERLMGGSEGGGLRELYLQPGRVWLHARPSDPLARQRISGWLDDLLALAAVAEKME